MKEIILLSLLFILVTFTHALFLLWGRSKKGSGRGFIWSIHLTLNGILWVILFGWIILLQRSFHDFQPQWWMQVLGAGLSSIGIFLVVTSLNKLGLRKAMGQRFFTGEKESIWINKGIYSRLANPMYDGFILILVGLGLVFGIVADFFIALVSYLLLNIFLASIENKR